MILTCDAILYATGIEFNWFKKKGECAKAEHLKDNI